MSLYFMHGKVLLRKEILNVFPHILAHIGPQYRKEVLRSYSGPPPLTSSPSPREGVVSLTARSLMFITPRYTS